MLSSSLVYLVGAGQKFWSILAFFDTQFSFLGSSMIFDAGSSSDGVIFGIDFFSEPFLN